MFALCAKWQSSSAVRHLHNRPATFSWLRPARKMANCHLASSGPLGMLLDLLASWFQMGVWSSSVHSWQACILVGWTPIRLRVSGKQTKSAEFTQETHKDVHVYGVSNGYLFNGHLPLTGNRFPINGKWFSVDGNSNWFSVNPEIDFLLTGINLELHVPLTVNQHFFPLTENLFPLMGNQIEINSR